MKTIQFLSITIFKKEDGTLFVKILKEIFRYTCSPLWLVTVAFMAINWKSPATFFAIFGFVAFTSILAKDLINVIKNDFSKKASMFRHLMTTVTALIFIGLIHIPFFVGLSVALMDMFSMKQNFTVTFFYVYSAEVVLFVTGMYIKAYKLHTIKA